MKSRSPILYVTGTDTGVGKTVLSVVFLRYLLSSGVAVMGVKPVVSGGREDAIRLHAAQGETVSLNQINPWYFRAALAPPLAARMEGRRLEFPDFVAYVRGCRLAGRCLLVEGAGGLLSPLGEGFDSRDLLTELGAAPIIVAPNRLGVVHQVRVVLAALPQRFRRRAIVVLSRTHPGTGGHQQNAGLLREFEPGIRLVTLPYMKNWQDRRVLASRSVREAMRELAGLAGLRES